METEAVEKRGAGREWNECREREEKRCGQRGKARWEGRRTSKEGIKSSSTESITAGS